MTRDHNPDRLDDGPQAESLYGEFTPISVRADTILSRPVTPAEVPQDMLVAEIEAGSIERLDADGILLGRMPTILEKKAAALIRSLSEANAALEVERDTYRWADEKHSRQLHEYVEALSTATLEIERLKTVPANINELLDHVSTKIAVDEWFKPAAVEVERTAFEVEAFARRIRSELWEAAVKLAQPYKDRAEAAIEEIERLKEALEAERERCAKVAEARDGDGNLSWPDGPDIANTIRAPEGQP